MELTPEQLQQVHIIKKHVQEYLAEAEAGHDWWHISRVYNTAQKICDYETVNRYVVLLGSLLHDIADSKFHNGDEDLGPAKAEQLMKEANVSKRDQEHVINIIKHMSFKNSFGGTTFDSPEMRVVQDADRLDAIGAIGIARAFSYGGHKGRIFLDPAIPPNDYKDKESYKKSSSPTINHFYEKLLKLKDTMHSNYAKLMAEERHQYMLEYLNQFYSECGIRPDWADPN